MIKVHVMVPAALPIPARFSVCQEKLTTVCPNNAHPAQHREEVERTVVGGWGPNQMRLTNLQTGEVDPRHIYGVENPAYAALHWHGVP